MTLLRIRCLLAIAMASSCLAQLPVANVFQPTFGSWNAPGNWSEGVVPNANHVACIGVGMAQAVTITTTPGLAITVAHISIGGGSSLTVTEASAPGDLTITTNRIDIYGTMSIGSKSIGSINNDFKGKATILLVDRVATGRENKSLVVHSGGSLLLYGDSGKQSWTRLADVGASKWQGGDASTSLSVDRRGAALLWDAEDRIAISTTDFRMNNSEVVELVGEQLQPIGSTLLLAQPLTQPHFSTVVASTGIRPQQVDMRAAVGRLSRNIRIVGETDEVDRWGGHVMVMQDGADKTTAIVHNVEFFRMGKYGRNGRYPLHFHECETMKDPMKPTRAHVESCSFHHCYHRAITVHDTHDAVIRDNVVYDTYGHAFFLEDGSETRNLFENNLGMHIRTPSHEDPTSSARLGTKFVWRGRPQDGLKKFFRYHDHNPAVFWISNYANQFRGNLALGSEAYGFVYDMVIEDYDDDGDVSNGLSSQTDSGVDRQLLGPGQFEFLDNTAGGCGRVGLFSDGEGRARPVDVDGSGVADRSSLNFVNFTAFKCRKAGLWYRQYNEAVFDKCVFADNALAVYLASDGMLEDEPYQATRFPSSPARALPPKNWSSINAPAMSHQVLRECLIVGDSANTGWDWTDNWDWNGYANRSLPHHREELPKFGPPAVVHAIDDGQPKIWTRGVVIYDGLMGIVDTHFQGFQAMQVGANPGEIRRAAAITPKGLGDYFRMRWPVSAGNIWQLDPRNYCSGISFDPQIDPEARLHLPAPPAPNDLVTPNNDPVLNSTGWEYSTGWQDSVLHDLDGSLAQALGYAAAPGFHVPSHNLLVTHHAHNSQSSSGTTSFLPTPGNAIASLLVEVPWDYWTPAPTVDWTYTSNLRNLVITPQGASSGIDVFEHEARLVMTADKWLGANRFLPMQARNKRMFHANIWVGPNGTALPEYDIDFNHDLAIAPMLLHELAVRLRFSESAHGAILRFNLPALLTPTGVCEADRPVDAPHRFLPTWSGEFAPSSRNYVQTQPVPNYALPVLRQDSGNSWHWTGSVLYVRIELPPRALGPTQPNKVYTGAEQTFLITF